MKKIWIALPAIIALGILVSNLINHKPPNNPVSASIHEPTEADKPVLADDVPGARLHPSDEPRALAPPGTHTGTNATANPDIENSVASQNDRYTGEVLFPYLSWDEKMRLYFHGRIAAAVRYPLGLDFQGVQQLSDNVYSINQQTLEQQAGKQDLLTHAKIDDSHGNPTFTEVVPGGVFDRLGIISGDQITSLDGMPIHSYADLYTAYQGLHGRNEVTLDIRRNGHPIQFTYFIQ